MRRINRCKLCRESGHNRTTCRLNPINIEKQCNIVIDNMISIVSNEIMGVKEVKDVKEIKKSKNGKNEAITLIDIKHHINERTPSGIRLIENLSTEYNINILNIDIVGGRGKHYDLIIHSDELDENKVNIMYKVEFKGSHKIKKIDVKLPPWYNGVQFYNGDPKPFTICRDYSKKWYDKFIGSGVLKEQYDLLEEIPNYDIWKKDAYRQGKNVTPFMIEFKKIYKDKHGPQKSMLEERKDFNAKFMETYGIDPGYLEILKEEINPIYKKIMRDKEYWLQIAGDINTNFEFKWTLGMAVIPDISKVTLKKLTSDIKFHCECFKSCDCIHDCQCLPFTFEAHLRWGYGQGFSNLRLDFK
jgi:hypothetical protein